MEQEWLLSMCMPDFGGFMSAHLTRSMVSFIRHWGALLAKDLSLEGAGEEYLKLYFLVLKTIVLTESVLVVAASSLDIAF
ncbi:hypothetical protein BVY04_02310 [bacterium M21]|nr:hypothetical protein BVY04_02310 [bacterium M21]